MEIDTILLKTEGNVISCFLFVIVYIIICYCLHYCLLLFTCYCLHYCLLLFTLLFVIIMTGY